MQNQHLIAVGLMLSATLAGAQAPLPPETLFEQASPSVWVVRSFDGNGRPLLQGSGVVIGSGRLITNCHVLRQARSVNVGRENVSFGATLEHADPERDLCQLRVANFHAPAVAIATPDGLRVGARVYAIGAPRGMETTISDGLISGLRRNAQDQLDAIQITVPLSPGSSGGGLFDAQGRLIGITTFGLRDAQNLNFALPAAWIAEVPARAQAALAARSAAMAAADAARAAPPTGDRVFEYRLTDRQTGTSQMVLLRADPAARQGDGPVPITQPLGGEFDQAAPPEGWIGKAPQAGQRWPLRYEKRAGTGSISMDLTAVAFDDAPMTIAQRTLPIVRVQYRGHTTRGSSGVYFSSTYLANAWYAPSLGRIVKFEAAARTSHMGASGFHIDERLELVDIRSE
ncbi:MAG: trypsin-like peptidase domain-containing protein [Hydrogenophaga sp.]|nr:trypsin-like peptidase domain-containing protein [Hydrogenophaga sp.]